MISASGIRIGMSAIAFAEPEVRRPLKIAITNITAMAAIEGSSEVWKYHK